MDFKQLFFYTRILFLLSSCSLDERDIIRDFNQQNYSKLERNLLVFPDTWRIRLYRNKLAVELHKKKAYSFSDISSLFLNDSLKESFSLQQIYVRFKIKPRDFVKTLLDLLDAEKRIQKSDFYYPELFKFLESKKRESQNYAVSKLLNQFNYRYKEFGYESFRYILNDSNYTKYYQDDIRKIASFYDRFEKETIYYDSIFDSHIESFLDSLKTKIDEERRITRPSTENDKEIKLKGLTSTDFYLLDKNDIKSFRDSIFQSTDMAYSFILSDRNIYIENRDYLTKLFSTKLSRTYQKYISEKIRFLNEDTILVVLLDNSIPLFAKKYFLDQIETREFSTKRITSYFFLFKEAKLQDELEERILRFNTDSLKYFLSKKLNSKVNQDIIFALYIIGKAGLESFQDRVYPFLASKDRNLKFEAEQTLNRLKVCQKQ